MTEINNIVDQIRLATDYQINKEILREKILTDLHLAHKGGLFKITPELLAFMQGWPIDDMYLEDVYHNPIQIDRHVFLIIAQQHYQKVMNRWHDEHEKLKKIRKV
jgi:hypothetical protein